ncbi:DNA polymerase III subunit beta [Blochmannia endosymbiont of Camponotus sp.]|uniref:DNA polymerase III subunit beta n=1 Tax=Blochmannia endosymbiont of Camponotus sp. TaxID=700220 RepID=UPI002024B83A|nr:DNA polymerase III subunit beta [Blochmannia endosymbiont of Camponotus sp.]URJ29773.1 DNA polymerase III subunit beta [Blochmannia endosymbiont of Camponotus sp.]URJ31327.1 DNA polymerase III subunit beta [Blochmannia endosymbiont of Camponotus sp.]
MLSNKSTINFTISRTSLYQPLQKVVSIISGRPRMPVLTHVLLEINDDCLYITATDLEIEITVKVMLGDKYPVGSITAPGRKLFEICRSLPGLSKISIMLKGNKLIICSGYSTFSLSTFPASDFPKLEEWDNRIKLIISQSTLKEMIELTQFSMGQQDARYYLNGIFFETKEHTLRIIATDGHRLASCKTIVDSLLPYQAIIIPRKGIVEILRLLNIGKKLVNIQTNNNSIRVQMDNYIFTSKLIDAVFPNCHDVFLKQPKNMLEVSCDIMKHALKRAAILSNEKLRTVQFELITNQLKITTHNFEYEASEEILDVLYSGEDIKISFNVDYLIDVLNVMVGIQILRFFFTNEISSVQIEGTEKRYDATYIVMPVRV